MVPTHFFPRKTNCIMSFTQYALVLGVNVAVYTLLPRESCYLLIFERDLIFVIKNGLSDSYDCWVTVNSCQNPLLR